MNVAEFDKKWELLNQLAKQVSYQLQHKVPPPPEHKPLKLLFMTQKWIKQVLLSELVEVQRMVHGGQRSQESAAQFPPRSAQLTRGISPVLTKAKANPKPKLNQIWLKDKDISLPGMHTAILTRPIVLNKINWKIAKTFKGSPLIWLIQSNDKISFPVGDLSCSFSLK